MLTVKLIVKNAFRHKLRTALTIASVTIAILSFGMLRTLIDAWYAGVAASSANRLVTRNSISLVFSLPIAYRSKIQQVDGVTLVSYGNWFGGVYIEEKNFFANFAVEPASYLELYPELVLSPKQKQAFLKDKKSAVAGQKVAARFGWKVGDLITLKGTIFPGNWDLSLQGVYRGRDHTVDETMFLFHWDYVNETMKKTTPRRADQIGFYIVGIKDPKKTAEIADAIDRLFKNTLAETLTETEKAFQMSFISMTEAIVIAIEIVSFVVIIIIMAVVANTMSMTARERMSEYATLKTLGFRGGFLYGIILGESLVVTVTGAALGIVMTYPVADYFSDKLGAFFPIFNVAKETLYLEFAAALCVAVVASISPAVSAIRIRIVDGLRKMG
jgi:putative ABC transport system permease protein